MQRRLPSRDVVLIGAGHTNMHIVRMFRMHPLADVRLTLVSPFSRATYSGMLPGFLAGLYTPDDMAIDLYRFCGAANVRLIVAPAVGLDPQRRRVLLADRPEIRFDVASVGIGSVPAGWEWWRDRPEVLSIKPMATFPQRLLQRLREAAGSHEPVQIAVVGGGAAGTEIAFCLLPFLQRHGVRGRVQLIERNPEILSGYVERLQRIARRELARRGIDVHTGFAVQDTRSGELVDAAGRAVPADVVIWAVGAAPPPELDGFALPKAEDGFLAVRPTLQTTADAPVFAVGDTGTRPDCPLPKAGVYAVREGPVLWENIQRLLAGRPLQAYDPQRTFLSLLATGDGRALGQYRKMAFHGRWVWRWKDFIDRRFMAKYHDYRPMTEDAARHPVRPRGRWSNVATAAATMRCRGCGGKIGANVLHAALQRLQIPPSRWTRFGLDHPDDATILDPAAGTADVLTVDFFQAFMDEPYLMGRIAALNALSDVWAMGGDPIGALAMVTLPEGPPRAQVELLFQTLAGGLRELAECGATLLGGHTIEGDSLMIGFTALGTLGGRTPWTKAGLNPGDWLVLTKPLGTGALLAGLPRARTRAEWMDAMLAVQLQPNRMAAEIARDMGVSAVTDVTGFGLAGHLLEMLQASGVDAALAVADVPRLPGFDELTREGIVSTLTPANFRAVAGCLCDQKGDPLFPDALDLDSGLPDEDATALLCRRPQWTALFDPQTSGGLLIAIAEERVAELIERLQDAEVAGAAVVARIQPQQDARPRIRLVESLAASRTMEGAT